MVLVEAAHYGGLEGFSQRWDAGHMLAVAAHGYRTLENAAFAPLFPATIRAASTLLPAWAAGLVVANTASLVFALSLCALYGPRGALLVLVVPSVALYTTAPYSESLALALSALGILAAARRRLWLSSALLGLASLARYQVGLASLGLALAAAYLWGPRGAARILVGPLVAGGLVALLYWHTYRDPLVYLDAEKLWGAGLALPLVGQARWILVYWGSWTLKGMALEPWMWLARNLVAYAIYSAGLAVLARKRRLLELGWSLPTVLLVASLRGVPAVSAPRLLSLAFPAVAALGEAGMASLSLLGLGLACMAGVAVEWHMLAFYA